MDSFVILDENFDVDNEDVPDEMKQLASGMSC